MKLIIGLGNPGKKYEQTWHNLGFEAVEKIRKSLAWPEFKKSVKFKAVITKGELNGETIILTQPQAFMNNSGLSAAALANYFKIKPADIIVIHDDLDLPLGKIRLTTNSSAGGHNGLKSIIEKLGTKNFLRAKIGIRSEALNKIDPADFVLMGWNKKDQKTVAEITGQAVQAVQDILGLGLTKAMNKWN